ncbi:MAG: thioredoxin family protein [Desulfobaccales bacterium]|nr:thioredoxin family protein [Desulfobaccales bacterium]
MKSGRRRTWGMVPLILGLLLLWQILPADSQSPAPPQTRPAIYEFGRKLCPICHQMEQVLKAVQERYPGQLEVRLLFIDEDIKLFRQFNIAIVPTQVFLDESGQEVFRHEGLLFREKLEKKLRELKFVRE